MLVEEKHTLKNNLAHLKSTLNVLLGAAKEKDDTYFIILAEKGLEHYDAIKSDIDKIEKILTSW